MCARHVIPLAMWFEQAFERDVMRHTRPVEECLDDVCERAQQRGRAPLAQHWKKCLPEGILVRLMSTAM
jgi:hypothetical protein